MLVRSNIIYLNEQFGSDIEQVFHNSLIGIKPNEKFKPQIIRIFSIRYSGIIYK